MPGDARRIAVAAALAGLAFTLPAREPVIRTLEELPPTPILLAQAANQARAVQGVNVRTGPGSQFPVVGVLRGGDVVGLAGCDPYWCRLSDGRGWVSRQYLAIGGEPATVASIQRNGQSVTVAPLPTPALFTGAWIVVPTPPAPPVTPGTMQPEAAPPVEPPPPPPPFQLLIAQGGDTVEGIARDFRMEGRVEPGGREAQITMTTKDGKLLNGRIQIEGSDNALTAVILPENGPAMLWRATRTILTR